MTYQSLIDFARDLNDKEGKVRTAEIIKMAGAAMSDARKYLSKE